MSSDIPNDPASGDLDEREIEALHEIELGLEWLQRAHGHLLQFHHATGHGMDHLDAAETLLRECGHHDLADGLRDDVLPRGVIDHGRWSYDVVEEFQDGMLAATVDFEAGARNDLANGVRHVAERRQERSWKRRSSEW